MSVTEWIALGGIAATLLGVGITGLASCTSFVFLWGRQTQAQQGLSKALESLSQTLREIHNEQVNQGNRIAILETRAGS